MSFHEIQFPPRLSFGSVGGPERLTEIVTLANGHEERNTPWQHSRRRYDAGVGMRSLDDVGDLIAFFEARRGRLHGFRWKDWADFKTGRASGIVTALDQEIGVGDGQMAEFQLRKDYASGGEVYSRPIAKPVAGTVLIAVDGTELVANEEYEVDPATGLVTFLVAPGVEQIITAGFEFDVPVRFETDTIQTSIASFQAGEIPGVPVLEVRL